MPERFRDVLERSLAVILEEHPPAYARLSETMAGREVVLEVDGPPFGVCFEPGAVRVGRTVDAPAVWGRFDRPTVLALADGELSIHQALLGGRLELRGGVEALVAFGEALHTYLNGAVRAPSAAAILESYRSDPAGLARTGDAS